MTIEPIKEKLDDKIAKLNSSRVYKKVTPRHDLSWYIKWASSVTLIFAMLFTSVNIFPLNLFVANLYALIQKLFCYRYRISFYKVFTV